MKKTLLITASLLTFAGCTTKTVYTPQPTLPVTDVPATVADDTDLFVSTIEDAYPGVTAALGGRSGLIRFGNLACQAIDEGSTLEDFALMAVDNGVDPEMIGFIVGASIVTFCPENQWFIDQYGA